MFFWLQVFTRVPPSFPLVLCNSERKQVPSGGSMLRYGTASLSTCPQAVSRIPTHVLPCCPPGDLLDPGIEPVPLKSPALPGMLFTTSATWESPSFLYADFRRFICSLLDYGNSLLSQPSLSEFSLTPNDLHCSPSLLSATAFPICVSQFS